MQQIGFYCRTYCSLNMFRAPFGPSSRAQDLYRWLLPMVFGALVYRSLVWCGAVGYVSGLRDVSQLVYRSLIWCGAVGYVSGLRDVSQLVYRSLVWCGAVGYVSGFWDVS